MIIIVIAIAIYPKKDTFFEKIKFKAFGFEFETSTKEKSAPPAKKEHSNRK